MKKEDITKNLVKELDQLQNNFYELEEDLIHYRQRFHMAQQDCYGSLRNIDKKLKELYSHGLDYEYQLEPDIQEYMLNMKLNKNLT